MNAVAPTAPSLSKREFLTSVFKDRRKILWSMGIVMGLALLAALFVDSAYRSRTDLLVLLGSEYAYRSDAGDTGYINQPIEREQVMRTEIELLSKLELHEEVVRRVGIERIYPDYVKEPSLLGSMKRAVQDGIESVLVLLGLAEADEGEAPDPVMFAAMEFGENITTYVPQEGNYISIYFSHEDPVISAVALNTLVQVYQERRQSLYADEQSPLVQEQAQRVQQELERAESALAAFKAEHTIANYDLQMQQLLTQRATLFENQQSSVNLADQLDARIAELKGQMNRTPAEIVEYEERNTDQRIENLKAQREELKVREIQLLVNYLPQSRPVREVQERLAAVDAEIQALIDSPRASAVRKGRSEVYDGIQLDLLRAQSEQQAVQARIKRNEEQLAGLDTRIAELNGFQMKLAELERERALRQEAYRSAMGILAGREISENVYAQKAANVRQISPARPPLEPTSWRLEIILAGLVLAGLVGLIVAVLSESMRTTFLGPDKLERTFGLPVLASVGDRPSLSFPRGGGPLPLGRVGS